jgi:hypothetical protein
MVTSGDPDRAAGLSRSSVSEASASPIPSNCGATDWWSRSPASVSETLLVVLVSSRTPSRSSISLIVWLRADGEKPSLAAALLKLRSRATARNVAWGPLGQGS